MSRLVEPAPSRRPRAERRLAERLASKVKPESSGALPPLTLPLIAIVLLASFSLLPRVDSQPALIDSFGLAVGALGAVLLLLYYSVRRSGRVLTYQFSLNRVHYVQLVMHSCIFAYWGMYWSEVYREIPLILAQVIFLYALDMMVCWFRRDAWSLGFGPFPIVFSTNLFLWFRDEWFGLQFLMIATIVLCKEFVKWERDGRRTHVFNPSASALFLFSMGLVLLNATGITWGPEIAVTMERPPYIFVELFVLSLIVQALFSVTLVTFACGVVLYGFNLAYNHITGTYFFIDTNIPPAVFLGSILLVTDPATSPRRLSGKVAFGALYGAAVIALYAILEWVHAPQFYDKLLCVPILNLMVRAMDRWSEAFASKLHPLDLLKRWGARNLNYASMAGWTALFALMTSTGFIGRGLSFKADCESGQGAACLAYGKLMTEDHGFPVAQVKGSESLASACNLGLPEGCERLSALVTGGGLKDLGEACDHDDNVACFVSGWVHARGLGIARNELAAAPLIQKACSGGFAPACSMLGTTQPK